MAVPNSHAPGIERRSVSREREYEQLAGDGRGCLVPRDSRMPPRKPGRERLNGMIPKPARRGGAQIKEMRNKSTKQGFSNNEYTHHGIYVALTYPGYAVPNSATGSSVNISSNLIDRAYRGIFFYLNNFPAAIESNTVGLTFDYPFQIAQVAMQVGATTNALIRNNYLSAFSSVGKPVLFRGHANFNSRILCNDVRTGDYGFLFESQNQGTEWKGNRMYDDLRVGMALKDAGIIGQQGSTGNPIDNEWIGGSWAGNVFSTFNYNSQASQSSLYIKSAGNMVPLNNGSDVLNLDYSFSGLNYTTGSFTCPISVGTGTMMTNLSVPSAEDFDSDDRYFISRYRLYQFLHTHEDSHAEEGEPLYDFYELESTTSIRKFMEVESSIAQGFYEEARAINNSIEVDYSLNAEPALKKYYDIYLNYSDSSFIHTSENDSLELLNLAHACPSYFGEVVSKACALFAQVYRTPIVPILECGDDDGGRKGFSKPNILVDDVNEEWNFEIRPNPSNGDFTVFSHSGTIMKIIIRDISGRCVYTFQNDSNSRTFNTNISHLPGLYFITVYNHKDESVTKKLVVLQ